jgi:AraC-like DNA-binding protein
MNGGRVLPRRNRTEPTLVVSLMAAFKNSGLRSAEEFRQSAPVRFAARAREALEAAVAAPPSLVRLAAELGTNRFALIRGFKQTFGITPHAFVLRLRVERARERLAQGARVADLALELGFADQAHFCRTFKRVTGLSPGRYARTILRRAVQVRCTFVQEK